MWLSTERIPSAAAPHAVPALDLTCTEEFCAARETLFWVSLLQVRAVAFIAARAGGAT
jgi:hypothetical protein